MGIQAESELARVNRKFARMTGREFVLWAMALFALVVASRFIEVGWFFFAGMLGGAVTWEFAKYRLRRNAEEFASDSFSA